VDSGLIFVAFGKSFEAYAAILNRILGEEGGIVDGLFEFTKPISDAYFWCPAVKDGRLNLSRLDIS
jgi:putative iron-dependent peroxidase